MDTSRIALSLAVATLLAAGASRAEAAPLSGPDARSTVDLAIPRPPIPRTFRPLFVRVPPRIYRVPPAVQRPTAPPVSLAAEVVRVRFALTTRTARRALRTIANRGPYERASVRALCFGAAELAPYRNSDPNAYFSENSWRSIFFGFMRAQIVDAFLPRMVEVFRDWSVFLDLGAIRPQLAHFYFRACYG